jgi:hypothetical protein
MTRDEMMRLARDCFTSVFTSVFTVIRAKGEP